MPAIQFVVRSHPGIHLLPQHRRCNGDAPFCSKEVCTDDGVVGFDVAGLPRVVGVEKIKHQYVGPVLVL